MDELMAKGQQVYNTNCMACHGMNGEGGVGKAIAGSAIANGDATAHIDLLLKGVSGTAMAAAGQETGWEGVSGLARPSSGRVRGRDADLHADGRAEAACRRQMPGPIRRDCPLRANEQVVYTAYTLVCLYV